MGIFRDNDSGQQVFLEHSTDIKALVTLIDYKVTKSEDVVSAEISALKKRVHELEMHQATQIGQDKIVGFVAGAFILSLISILAPFFIRFDNVDRRESHSSVSSDLVTYSRVQQNNRPGF
ncbi:MAG: hypothetical protein AAGA83_06885 [Cyanobacteria bacterium P01_F01_bin.116]